MANPILQTAKIERLVDTYDNILVKMEVPQIAYTSNNPGTPDIQAGTVVTREATTFHAMAAQFNIDAATKVATRADNIFGNIDVTSVATNYVDYSNTEYASSDPSNKEGRTFYDGSGTLRVMTNDPYSRIWPGRGISSKFYNDTGGEVIRGTALFIASHDIEKFGLQVEKASNIGSSQNYIVGVAGTSAADGELVEVVQKGIIVGMDTSGLEYGKIVWLSDTPGGLTTNTPTSPSRHVIVGSVLVQDAVNGILGVGSTIVPYEDLVESSYQEVLDIDVVVTGGIIGLEVESTNGGDFYLQMKGEFHKIDATTGDGTDGVARIELTAGTSTVPVKNYIYTTITDGEPVLTNSTTRPSTNYAMIAEVTALDAATTNTYGPLLIRLWTNAKVNGIDNDTGFVVAIAERLRLEGAKYDSGMESTVTITPNGGAMDNLKAETTTGVVYQLWVQTFGAFSTLDDGCWVANASGTGLLGKYDRLTDLGDCLELTDGTAITNNQRFNLVIFYTMNSAGYIKSYVNLPTAVYGTDVGAYEDNLFTAITAVPDELRTTAFLGIRIPLKYTTGSSGTLSFINGGGQPEVIELFGTALGGSARGTSTPALSSFSDTVFNIYDNTDDTAILNFDCTGISTASTRILTALDTSGSIATEVGVPASAAASGKAGSIAYESGTLYVCVSDGAWEKVTIATW